MLESHCKNIIESHCKNIMACLLCSITCNLQKDNGDDNGIEKMKDSQND